MPEWLAPVVGFAFAAVPAILWIGGLRTRVATLEERDRARSGLINEFNDLKERVAILEDRQGRP